METRKSCQQCGAPLAADAPQGLCPACLMKVAMATGSAAGDDSKGFIPPTVRELSAKFPQLEILELIGKGGMGAVYKARQKELDRIVALKILPPGIGEDAAFAERFTREAKALARLNHPGIVTVHDFGRADGLFYFLMEYVDGVNLRQLLAGGRISAREALAIVPQICDALQFAHDQGIVHRDIKPENILMDRRGRVKVADFGLAKIVGQASRLSQISEQSTPQGGQETMETGATPALRDLTDAGKTMGTPQYMSPEQVEAPGEVDHRADIYALGVVFYQMLTGELPGKKIEPPSKKVQIDVRLDEVVLRALEKKPELRYQQVSEVKTMVETIVATPGGNEKTEPGKTKSSAPPPPVIYAGKKTKGEFMGIGCAIQAIGLGCFFIPFIGPVLGIILLIIGGRMALKLVCSNCGNRINQDAKTCPSCGAHFEQRFSRKAIMAACWPLFSVLALIYYSRSHHAIYPPGFMMPWWLIIIYALGFTAPFGTTILGWVAVTQIRRSAGNLYGLWLAVFDGLLFPLLVLNLLIGDFTYAILLAIGKLVAPDLHGGPGTGLVILFSLLIAIPFDWLIIRRVWRVVNKDGAVAPPAEPGRKKSWGRTFAVSLGTLVLLLVLFTLFRDNNHLPWHSVATNVTDKSAVWHEVHRLNQIIAPGSSGEGRYGDDEFGYEILFSTDSVALTVSHREQAGTDYQVLIEDKDGKARPLRAIIHATRQVAGNKLVEEKVMLSRSEFNRIAALTLQVRRHAEGLPGLSFGPVVERTLPFNTNGMTDAFCLESNQVVKLPHSGRLPDSLLFLDDHDGNAIYIGGQLGVLVMPVKNQSWETISTVRSTEMLAAKTNLWSITLVKKSDLPAIFLFTTQRGMAGVLKIANSTDREDGLNLNYKFITENWTNAVPFPPQDYYSQTIPPTGFKPIPPEAVRLFQQSRELVAAQLFNLPHAETRVSLLEWAKTQMELKDISRKLAPLLKGTAFDAAQWRQMNAAQKWQQLDPNKDKEKWNQAEKELHIAQFTTERLMAEAGAAEIIQPGAGKLKFGPWTEAVVSHPSLGGNCCVQCDAGKVLTPPAEILTAMTVTNRPGNDFFEAMPESFFWAKYRADSKATNKLARWIEDSNVDAMALGTYGLVVFCPVRSSMKIDETGDDADWEKQITPAWLLWKIYFTEKMNAGPKPANTYEVLTLPTATSASTNDLCYFRTRSGTLGLMQITGFTENPRGVRLRYKLVQEVGANNTAEHATLGGVLSEDELATRTRGFVEDLAAGRVTEARARFHWSQQIVWTEDRLREWWRKLTMTDGKLVRIETPVMEKGMLNTRSATVLCVGEKGRFGLRVSFFPSGEIEGVTLLPQGTDVVPPAPAISTLPENPAVPQNLSFGPETNGLRMAVELTTTNGGVQLGEPIEVRFHVRNVSKRNILISGTSWRQLAAADILIITDEQRRKLAAHRLWYSGLAPLLRHELKPGETAVFPSSRLEFLPENADASQISHPVGAYVKARPGRYTVSYNLHFPDMIEASGPQPYDWQGNLETGPVTVEVKAPSTP